MNVKTLTANQNPSADDKTAARAYSKQNVILP